MNNKPTRPTAELLKRKAKNIRKSSGITHSQALDTIAREQGYKDWKHYRIESKQVQNQAKTNVLKRPAIIIPAEIDYHDVFHSRVLGQRPNRSMSAKRHKKIGKILAELLEETRYHKRANNILSQIRVNLDIWLGYEYDQSIMGDATFNSIYYGNHTEFLNDIPSIKKQARLRTLLRKAKQILISSYHDCKPLGKMLGQFDNAMTKLEKWPKSVRVKGSPKRQILEGTFVKLKQTNDIIVVFNHDTRDDSIVGYGHAGKAEVDRHEVSVLRSQPDLSKYIPLRLYLPYGRCKLDDGTEVLFNRDFCSLWSRSPSGTVQEADLKSDLNINRAKYFFSDHDAPYTKKGSTNLQLCLEILDDWGVIDRHHKILDRFRNAVERGKIGDIIQSRCS